MPQNIRIPEWKSVLRKLWPWPSSLDNCETFIQGQLSSLATEMMEGVGEDYQEDTPIDKGMNLEKHIIADRLKKVAERWGIDLTNK